MTEYGFVPVTVASIDPDGPAGMYNNLTLSLSLLLTHSLTH